MNVPRWLLMLAALIWLILNFIVIPGEERGLEDRHQDRYRQYQHDVPRWFRFSRPPSK